ncbi:MAG TPA: nicotinate-nucleotide adenylyltransferase [Candidatus Limnocylindria bacterium]|nr:nicotinate-nucleotide adenylyltransferase [Candidatus Limnocylindria bacterium]
MSGVGVFGGTFDPVHVGHLAIANAALDDLGLDHVYFVPARRSPLKQDGPIARPEDRLAMLTVATGDEPRFRVSLVELERSGPSFTVDTLESLRGEGPLFLILGSDAYADFERWREPERIRGLATIVLAARPGAPNAPAAVRMLDSPLMDISSRELRARAARGRSLRYLVPEGVLRYIEEHRLYR